MVKLKGIKGLEAYLHLMVEKEASDLYFSVGAPVNLRIEGVTKALSEGELTTSLMNDLIAGILSSEQLREYKETMEMNLSFSIEDVGRFRVNVYRQRGEPAMVIRYIKTCIPTIEQLHLPSILKSLIMEPRGLILVVGATGSGKSTTLASMIDHRNSTKTGHILTVEEPIEFVHEHKRSIVDQREVGLDTLSYSSALKNAMREAPDVILIGEIRDEETMRQAITYSETGHLCLSTLHANNANQTLDRVVNFFPESAHRQLLQDLSANLKAVISQRLVRGTDGKRLPVVEIMLNSLHVADLIAKGEFESIKQAMEHSEFSGMCTFDQCLFDLYKRGQISEEVALENADSRNNVHVSIQLSKGKCADEDIKHLVLNMDEETKKPKPNTDENGGVTYAQRKAGGE